MVLISNNSKVLTYRLEENNPYTAHLSNNGDTVIIPQNIDYIPSGMTYLCAENYIIENGDIFLKNQPFSRALDSNKQYNVTFKNLIYNKGVAYRSNDFMYTSNINVTYEYEKEMDDEIKLLTHVDLHEGDIMANYPKDVYSIRPFFLSAYKASNNSKLKIEEIVIPSHIKYIEAYAFMNSHIKKIDFSKAKDLVYIENSACSPQSNTIFDFTGCSKLKFIGRIGGSGSSSGPSSIIFDGCTSLHQIGDGMHMSALSYFTGDTLDLSGCPNLRVIHGLCNWSSYLTNVIFPQKLKTLSGFKSCPKLTTLEIPDSVQQIGYFCEQCSGLTNIVLPRNLKTLDSNVLCNCENLKTIDFSKSLNLQSIASSVFNGCTSLEQLDLSSCHSLKTIGSNFCSGCTSLTEVILPGNIETINASAFNNCPNLTRIYIDGPYQSVPGAPWGATNATIEWRSAQINYNITPNDAIIYFNGVKAENQQYMTPILGDNEYTIYHKDYVPYHGIITNVEVGQTYNINVELTDTNGHRLEIVPDQTDAEITISYDECSLQTDYVVVPNNTEVSYTVKKNKYKTITDVITVTETQTIDLIMEYNPIEDVVLSYPFDSSQYSTFTLDNLIDGSNFIVDDTTLAIINGSKSYNVNNGASYGYIEFTTPDEETSVSITGYVSSENNWDFGAVYIGTAIYQPTQSQCKNKTTDGNGEFLLLQSGTSNASKTYTTTLQPSTKYYLNFVYVKDSSSKSGDDRMYITNIQFNAI